MGERLGLGRWDEAAFNAGRGEQWPAFKARVLAAHQAWEVSSTAIPQPGRRARHAL